jgi:hypothetical protein
MLPAPNSRRPKTPGVHGPLKLQLTTMNSMQTPCCMHQIDVLVISRLILNNATLVPSKKAAISQQHGPVHVTAAQAVTHCNKSWCLQGNTGHGPTGCHAMTSTCARQAQPATLYSSGAMPTVLPQHGGHLTPVQCSFGDPTGAQRAQGNMLGITLDLPTDSPSLQACFPKCCTLAHSQQHAGPATAHAWLHTL